MATEGKIPVLGFKAGAVKFLTLLGFSVGAAVTTTYYPPDYVICVLADDSVVRVPSDDCVVHIQRDDETVLV